MKFRFADKIATFNVDLSWIERCATAIAGLAIGIGLTSAAVAAEPWRMMRSPSTNELAAAKPVVAVLAQDDRTPFGLGLIAVAAAEALVARQQLDAAIFSPDRGNTAALDDAIRTTLAVLDGHDDTVGLRFGLTRSVTLMIEEIQKIKPQPRAAADVTRYQVPAINQAKLILARTDRIRADGTRALASSDPVERRELLVRMGQTIDTILYGFDADNDGRITWAPAEGGLAQLHDIMGYVETVQGVDVACPALPSAVSPILDGFQRDGFSCDMIKAPEEREPQSHKGGTEVMGRLVGNQKTILAFRQR